VARWSKSLSTLRSTILDKIFTYNNVATRGTHFSHLGTEWAAVVAGDGEAVWLASGVVAGKIRCSSGEDEGTKGGGGLR
jgi:hypothetical protein